jgi:hypothetical protein
MGCDSKGKWHQYRSIGDTTYRKCKNDEEPDDTFVAIAAWTTSAARVYMHELRAVAGERECYYQYTDSLFVTKKGYTRLCDAGYVDHNTIGKLKTYNEYATIEVRGPGWINYGDRLKACGIGENAIKTGHDTYLINHATSPNGIFGRNGKINYAELPIPTTYPPPETRGEVDAKGWVQPVRLPMADCRTRIAP